MTRERRLASLVPENATCDAVQIALSHVVPKFAWFIVDGDVAVLQISHRNLSFCDLTS
jgi:hypothetical protein